MLELARALRLYLVQENGPTKLVFEDSTQRKFKVQIGSDITCSCGGGKDEHCVHTVHTFNQPYFL